MAKRTTNGSMTAPGRSRAGEGPANGNRESRPEMAAKTNDKRQIFSHVRQKRLAQTPEQRVRQAYVVTLHNKYGFNLDQMDAELHVAGGGSGRLT